MALAAYAAPVAAQEPPPSPPRLDESGAPPPQPLPEVDGKVELLFDLLVDAEGQVRQARLLECECEDDRREALALAAWEHLSSLRFLPARHQGRARSARLQYRVRFPSAHEAASDLATTNAATNERIRTTAPTTPKESELGGRGLREIKRGKRNGPFGAKATVKSRIAEQDPVSIGDQEIELGNLRRVPRSDAQSLLTLAPGILLTNYGGVGHPSTMYLRGFDAAEGEDLEMKLEGIPLNEVSNAHGHGYADTLFIMPELVRSLRVTQGPFDPEQGNFAVAGSAEYRLGLRKRGIHVLSAYGTYQRRRLALWWAPQGQSEGTFVGVSLQAGDGFGPNRAFANATAIGQYEGYLQGKKWRYRLLAFGAMGRWDNAGVLRADDFEARRLPCAGSQDAQFFCTYDPNQGGSSARVGISPSLRWQSANELAELGLFGMGRNLRVQENFTGFLNDPRTDGGAQRGDNLDQQYNATTLGFRSRYRRRWQWLDHEQYTEVGAYMRYDDADTAIDRRRRELNVPYATDFRRRIRETNVAAYLRSDLRLLEWFALSGGVRADMFGFHVRDRNRPAEDRLGPRLPYENSDAYGVALQPRGTLRFIPRPGLEWLVSAGVGARSSDAAALSQDEFAPFTRVTSFETGPLLRRAGSTSSRGIPSYKLEARSSIFFTRVERDLVFDANAGRNSLSGPSHRSGWMAFGRFAWRDWFDLQASLTYTRAHLPPEGASTFDLFAGPRLPFVPEWLARLDAAAQKEFQLWGQDWTLSGALGLAFVGRRPLPFDQYADPWFVVDASTGLRWRWIELSLIAENLLDARYRQAEFNYASNFNDPSSAPSRLPARHFAAGPPFQLMAQLTLHLDFDGRAKRPPSPAQHREETR